MSEMRARLVLEADGSAIAGVAQKSTASFDKISAAAMKTGAAFEKVSTSSLRSGTALGSVKTAIDRGTTSLSQQTSEMIATQRETAAYRAELDRVRAQFDPLFAAQTRYQAELRAIGQAERDEAISAEVASAARLRAKVGYDALIRTQGRVLGSSRAMAGGIQNASYQIADAAVQLQAGVGASIVVAQQLPQLLGGMGIIGAVLGAVVAVGAPFIKMMLDGEDAAGTLDQRMQKLDGSLQSVGDHLKILRDQDLSLTFGNMSDDVRGLTQVLLELDRVAELKNLQAALDKLLNENVKPSLLQSLAQSISLGAAPMPNMTAEDYLTGNSMRRENFNKLTGGIGPSYEEFNAQRQSLMESAKAGDVESVTTKVKDMLAAFSDGKPVTEMNKDLLQMLTTLGSVAKKTAEVEAQFNGTAQSAKLDKQMGEISRRYREQADLAQAIAQYGEHSAQVAALRNAQAKDALTLRLREMGIEAGSAREQQAYADLAAAQAAEAKVTAAERQKSYDQTIASMMREIAMSDVILAHGENSVQVERERTAQAKAILAEKMREQGITEDQIAAAQQLLETERARANEVKRAEAARKADQSLAQMQREAAIGAAIARYGQSSLEVKRLQIEAARAEYVESLKTLEVSAKRKQDMLDAWDAAKGLASADPFGSVAAARQILQTQAASIAKLQLEQSLIGQSEITKRRVLALYEAELEIRQKNIATGSEAAAKIREQARAQADLNDEVERQGAAWEKVQKSMGSAIDKLLDGDFSGALDGLRKDLEQFAIANPLKNALLGTNEPTLADAGGLAGIWARLTGKAGAIDPAQVAAQAAAHQVAAMQVTAGTVTISTMGGSSLLGGAAAANFGGSPGNLTGSDSVQSQVWKFFAGKDLAPHQIAAIMGNIQRESGFDPFAVGDGGTSFGLFQHHAGRGQGLLNAVGGQAGLGSIQAQLEYVWQELLGPESAVLKRLMSATNVQDATSAFVGFERPQGWSMANPMGADGWSERISAAQEALTKFSTTTLTSTANLGNLGQGFDAFGAALSQIGAGGAGAGGGLFSALLGPILSSLGIPGFSEGSYTGGSDPKRVAGVVHEKEFVFDARATARIGVGNLEALRKGTLRGFESGGYVDASAYPFLSDRGASRQDVVSAAPSIQIINNSSAQISGEYEETMDARGQRQVKFVLSDTVASGLSVPGGKARRTMETQFGIKRRGINR
ncbi:MAG: hypothetical protein IE938_19210 [Pseudomonas balearica]|nr:hypothetical protein [Stutzerimonas balearica]